MAKKKSQKLWSGRFSAESAALLSKFNDSLPFDKRLYKEDIEGSIAHAKMLGKCKIIPLKDSNEIVSGLKKIKAEIDSQGDKWFQKYKNEDIHSAIEGRLVSLIGETGKKLHTGRSRNDQVATDIRLFLKKEVKELISLAKTLKSTFKSLAKKHYSDLMPGYTHLQIAQPITLGHYLLAHSERVSRDINRLEETLKRMDVLPLGSGALAGTTFKIDRKYTAKLLGFKAVSKNSLDSVSDRDFIAETIFDISIIGVHLSQLAEEMIIFNSNEFGFITISDSYATGSSMMPQKKNPDIPELLRGKTGRYIGSLVSILNILKGLPLAYNKDLQEDKEMLFDSIDNINLSLRITNAFLKNIKFNKKRLYEAAKSGFSNATDVADYLANKGIPFRQSYKIVGEIVAYCLKEEKGLENLSISEWKKFNKLFTKDITNFIQVENCIKRRNSFGGTAPKNVLSQIR